MPRGMRTATGRLRQGAVLMRVLLLGCLLLGVVGAVLPQDERRLDGAAPPRLIQGVELLV